MAEDLIPHSEVQEGATIVRNTVTPETVENNHASAPNANANFVTPVTNGTATLQTGKNYPQKVTGPTAIKAGEKLEYVISEYKINNEANLDNDKSKMRWCFYIDGVTLSGSKKHVKIKSSPNQKEDSDSNFLSIENTVKKTQAIESKAYLYAKTEIVEEGGTKKNKLTIVFSKWLDGKKIHVEAYRNKPDHNPNKDYVVTATLTAKPEILNAFWCNAKKEPIKTAGYKQDIYICLETLGMVKTTIPIDVYEDDYNLGNEKIKWENNTTQITGLRTFKKFKIPKKNNAHYKSQRGGFEGSDLELFFKLPNQTEAKGWKSNYGKFLILTTDEKITKAYFAVQKEREVLDTYTPSSTEETTSQPTPAIIHTVKVTSNASSLSAIANAYPSVTWQQIAAANNISSPYTISKDQQLTIPNTNGTTTANQNTQNEETEKEIYYEKIDKSTLGGEVHIVVESLNLHGKEALVKIFEKEKLLVEKDSPLPVLNADAEVTELKANFDDTGKAVIKVQLRKKTDEDFKKQKKKFEVEEDKDAIVDNLYIKVTCEGDDTSHEEEFLKRKGFKVELSKCFCNRDLTEEEVKKIIIDLRKSETSVYKGENKEKLFWKPNCELPQKDKTFKRFTEELNKVFKAYNINTCIRRMHFLAQSYHETDRFRTTEEYDTTKSYAPYIGRGVMQLTWKSGYKNYKLDRNKDFITNYKLISNDLFNSFDSAGWFWKRGKTLSRNNPGIWKAPSFDTVVGKAVAKENPSCKKEIITYGSNTKKYAIINFNLLADNDWIDTISWLVNGGSNGFQERRDYLKKIKNIFKYDTQCISNSNKSESESIVSNGVTLNFIGATSKESSLSTKTKNILKEVGKASNNMNIHVTSTARTPYDQARIMYENCKSTGAATQKAIYSSSGDKVIDVYITENNLGKSKKDTIKKMEEKIKSIGPSKISKHLADPDIMNTFDISYGNLTNKSKFWDEMKKRSELDKILEENNCYHIQINQ